MIVGVALPGRKVRVKVLVMVGVWVMVEVMVGVSVERARRPFPTWRTIKPRQ